MMFKLIRLSRPIVDNLKFLLENNSNKLYSNYLPRRYSSEKSSKIIMDETAKQDIRDKQNRIVWVDLEMSGLNIVEDHILEMACLITDKDLNIIAEGPELIIKQSEQVLNGMDDWCKKTHGDSGLTKACIESKISIEHAEELMLDFIKKHVPSGSCPLAGNSIHVDRMFLDKYMKNFLNHLHYRIIDVSTVKELSKRWYSDNKIFSKKNSHRALDDIKESIQELKYFRSSVFK